MTSREKTKTYLAKKEIPQLFESMMTGLMYFKPENHLEYLQECITKAKDSDGHSLQWNTFVEDQVQMRKTSPLPPITTEPLERQPTFATEPSLLDLKTTSPLPPIASINRSQNLRHIFVIGGPGSGKAVLCEKLDSRYAEYHHLSVGQMIRDKISDIKEDDSHLSNLKSIVAKGHLLSETDVFEMLKAEISSQTSKNPNMLGFIFEGYPRTMGQLKLFEDHYGHPDLLLYLECDEQILRYRLEKRRAINKREDDTEEATESRMTLFLKNTPCLFENFPDDFKKVNADRDEDEVFYDVANMFDELFYLPKTPEAVSVDLILNAKSPPLPPIANSQTKSSEENKEKEELVQLATELLNTEENDEPVPEMTDEPKTEVIEEVIEKKEAHITGEDDQTLPDSEGLGKQQTKSQEAATPTLKDAKVIFVIGGPGSGKGTQCAKLVEKYSFTHLSSGDLLRAEVKSGSERGKQLTEIMEKGELVPQDVVLQLLKESMEASLASSKVFLIDGYPRKLEQGIEFEKEITECQFVLFFEVSDEEMTNRLLKRGETSGRADDNEETIKKRLAVFHELTTPVLDHYKEKTKKVVAESGTPDDIFVEVVNILEGHGIVAAAAEKSEQNATPSEEQKEEKPLETNDAKTEESKPEETEAKTEEKGNDEATEKAPAEPADAPKTEDKPEEAASEEKVEEPASEEKAEEPEQKEGVAEPEQASEEKPEQASEENAVDEKKEETDTKEESPEETKTEENTESAKEETTPGTEGNTGGGEEKVEESITEETKTEDVPETDKTDG